MAGFQQTIIIGNVGRSPEMRYTQNGTAVCSFSVAVTESWTDRESSEKREKTNWYKVTAWRSLAEVCNQYVTKGMQIHVVGNVEASAYMSNDNTPKASLELTARDVRFLGGRGNGNNANDDEYDGFTPPPRTMDDIPF